MVKLVENHFLGISHFNYIKKVFGINFANISSWSVRSLKTLTSLNKDSRPFFLGDDSIWRFPSVSSLINAAFGHLDWRFPKYYFR